MPAPASSSRGASSETSAPAKYPCRSNADSAPPAIRRLPVGIQRPHPNPVVQRLHRQMQIFVGLQLNHRQPPVAVQRQQVQHAAVAR